MSDVKSLISNVLQSVDRTRHNRRVKRAKTAQRRAESAAQHRRIKFLGRNNVAYTLRWTGAGDYVLATNNLILKWYERTPFTTWVDTPEDLMKKL